MFSLYMKGVINNMELLEKIILTILVYLLIGIFGLGAAISYLMLNDIGAMSCVGYVGCPKDSCFEVKQIADYVSSVEGGRGAVRDVIEHLLRSFGRWDEGVKKVYNF